MSEYWFRAPNQSSENVYSQGEIDQAVVAEFYDGLVADGVITNEFYEMASHHYSSSGYQANLQRVPPPLARHITANLDEYPGLGSASIDLAYSVTPRASKKFQLDFLRLGFDDLGSYLLAYEEPLSKLYAVSDDELDVEAVERRELDVFVGPESLSSTIRALLPSRSGFTNDEKIARSIYELSPEVRHTAELRDGSVYLFSDEQETAHDSRRSVELHASYQHPCGKTVLLKAGIEESLAETHAGLDAAQSLLLQAGYQIFYHEIENNDGKVVAIESPRLSHAAILRNAVETLIETNASQSK